MTASFEFLSQPQAAVNQPRRLLPNHPTRPQDNLVILAPVVLDDDDGGDDVGGQLVHVGQEARVGVLRSF